MDLKNIEYIIWDFNGTLLDDVNQTIKTVNIMLEKRGLLKTNLEKYKKDMAIPLIKYYQNAGFDIENENYEEISKEFRAIYNELDASKLFDSVVWALKTAKERKIKNVLISSLNHDLLIQTVKELNIFEYFYEICGLPDGLAGSKIHLAKEFLERNKIDAKNVLVVGDMEHDFEMADYIGAKCVICENGHQFISEKIKKKVTKINDLLDIFD